MDLVSVDILKNSDSRIISTNIWKKGNYSSLYYAASEIEGDKLEKAVYHLSIISTINVTKPLFCYCSEEKLRDIWLLHYPKTVFTTREIKNRKQWEREQVHEALLVLRSAAGIKRFHNPLRKVPVELIRELYTFIIF